MSDEQKTPPIVEMDYLRGVKVVDIGDLRVARGMSRRPVSACTHHQMVYDERERRIWCKDCETDVEPFDAFLILTKYFSNAKDALEREWAKLAEAKAHSVIRVAAKRMDELFRRKNTVPSCPHCHAGIFPEDVAKMGSVNRDWETAKRQRALAGEKPLAKLGGE